MAQGDEVTRRIFIQAAGTATAAAAAVGTVQGVPMILPGNADKPAMLGGTAVKTTPWPTWPQTDKADEQIVMESLKEKRWCYLRPGAHFCQDFEKTMSRDYGGHVYLTNAGTNALHACLAILDVGPGDEVIVPGDSFIATLQAVLNLHALPVFVDVDPESGIMDPALLERAITPNTKAIMPVHLFGASADMDGIMNVARKRNIKVVEDACQSPYVEWDGTKLGLIGDCGAISFNVWKTLGCGDGGAIVARDKDVAIAADAYRDNGRARNGGDRAYMGMNYRPTEMQAALLTSQLERYKKQAPLRDKNAKYLTKGLQDIAGLYPLKVYSKISNHNWYNYMIRYDADEMGGLSIGKFARAMDAEGMRMGAHDEGHIMAQDGNLTRMLKGRHFKRIYTSRQIQHCEDSRKCPHAKHLAANMLQVNQYVLLGSQKDMDGILEAVDKVRKNAGALAKA